jgi:O-acetylhomoserine/O-acetylserine sulfhydrylase-like pyridoxal-dependent enzyme
MPDKKLTQQSELGLVPFALLVSVSIENIADIKADLEQAFAALK